MSNNQHLMSGDNINIQSITSGDMFQILSQPTKTRNMLQKNELTISHDGQTVENTARSINNFINTLEFNAPNKIGKRPITAKNSRKVHSMKPFGPRPVTAVHANKKANNPSQVKHFLFHENTNNNSSLLNKTAKTAVTNTL